MAWISKKAKSQMRVRRKKKEKHSTSKRKRNDDHDNDHDDNDNDDNDKNVNVTTDVNVSVSVDADDGNNKNWKNIQKEATPVLTTVTTVTAPAPVTVTIASTLTTKEAKKIRKDARRKARKDKREEHSILFVDENGNPLSSSTTTTTTATTTTTNKDEEEKKEDDDNNNNNDDNKNDDENENENEDNKPTKKRKKHQFPNINQLLAHATTIQNQKKQQLKQQSYENSIPNEIKSQYMALDCEMVGIGAEGKQSALARVSITNWDNETILDTFVQVPDRVTDFRTYVSGVRAKDIRITSSNAMELHACRSKVGEIIKGKILVGHSLKNDFSALMLGHPKHLIRDTARYKPFMRASGRNGGKLRPRKLRDLVKEHVGLVIQKEGEAHTSVEDANATIELYKVVREQWEKELDKLEATKNKKKR